MTKLAYAFVLLCALTIATCDKLPLSVSVPIIRQRSSAFSDVLPPLTQQKMPVAVYKYIFFKFPFLASGSGQLYPSQESLPSDVSSYPSEISSEYPHQFSSLYPSKYFSQYPSQYRYSYPSHYPLQHPSHYPLQHPSQYPLEYPVQYQSQYLFRYPYPSKYPLKYPSPYHTPNAIEIPSEVSTKFLEYPTEEMPSIVPISPIVPIPSQPSFPSVSPIVPMPSQSFVPSRMPYFVKDIPLLKPFIQLKSGFGSPLVVPQLQPTI